MKEYKQLGKEEIENQVKELFSRKSKPSQKEIKKAKKLAMSKNIKLGSLRKKFCKKCYSTNLKVNAIKHGKKTIECRDCGFVDRWKIK